MPFNKNKARNLTAQYRVNCVNLSGVLCAFFFFFVFNYLSKKRLFFPLFTVSFFLSSAHFSVILIKILLPVLTNTYLAVAIFVRLISLRTKKKRKQGFCCLQKAKDNTIIPLSGFNNSIFKVRQINSLFILIVFF